MSNFKISFFPKYWDLNNIQKLMLQKSLENSTLEFRKFLT